MKLGKFTSELTSMPALVFVKEETYDCSWFMTAYMPGLC
jgi:hypothetical protein